jgi:hypothetical protein
MLMLGNDMLVPPATDAHADDASHDSTMPFAKKIGRLSHIASPHGCRRTDATQE